MTPHFRPIDESQEDVDWEPLAAVEALRRLEREDQLGRVRGGDGHRGRRGQSGAEHVSWLN
eukprot:3738139-Pyramimonas_sp.AAC.1